MADNTQGAVVRIQLTRDEMLRQIAWLAGLLESHPDQVNFLFQVTDEGPTTKVESGTISDGLAWTRHKSWKP